MTGKVIMPDEEYLQSWWYGVPLGTSETHSDRMECTANGWGTFIGIIALMKITVALTGGKTTLAKTLGALSVAGNIWTIKVFLPMNDLMEAYRAGWPSIIQSNAPCDLSVSAQALDEQEEQPGHGKQGLGDAVLRHALR